MSSVGDASVPGLRIALQSSIGVGSTASIDKRSIAMGVPRCTDRMRAGREQPKQAVIRENGSDDPVRWRKDEMPGLSGIVLPEQNRAGTGIWLRYLVAAVP